MPELVTPTPPRHHRFRYSLRTMLALTTAAAIFFGWLAYFLDWKRKYDVPPPDRTVVEQPLLQKIGFRYSRFPEMLVVSASDFAKNWTHPDLQEFLSKNQSIHIVIMGNLVEWVSVNDSIVEFRRQYPNIKCVWVSD